MDGDWSPDYPLVIVHFWLPKTRVADEDGKRGTVIESATMVRWDDGTVTSEPAYNLTRAPDDWGNRALESTERML